MESTALDHSTSYVRDNLDLHLVNGRYSAGLVCELANVYEGRTGSVFAVFDEIATLEEHPIARPSLTNPRHCLQGHRCEACGISIIIKPP
jgi:hypothetical protein